MRLLVTSLSLRNLTQTGDDKPDMYNRAITAYLGLGPIRDRIN